MNNFLVSKKVFSLLNVLVKTAMKFAPDCKKGPHANIIMNVGI